MTVATLCMAGIHQVSNEFFFQLIILWKDMQDLQISHTWNIYFAGRLELKA
jgi:hypothetical protein